MQNIFHLRQNTDIYGKTQAFTAKHTYLRHNTSRYDKTQAFMAKYKHLRQITVNYEKQGLHDRRRSVQLRILVFALKGTQEVPLEGQTDDDL